VTGIKEQDEVIHDSIAVFIQEEGYENKKLDVKGITRNIITSTEQLVQSQRSKKDK